MSRADKAANRSALKAKWNPPLRVVEPPKLADSWWTRGAQPDQFEVFSELADARNKEHNWTTLEQFKSGVMKR